MRQNILASTASSFAIAALSATAFIFGMPVSAQATTYCENSGGSCTTGGDTYEASPFALTAGNNMLFETTGTTTVANGVTVGTVLSNVASTGAGTGILTITPGAGTTGAGAVGSATNYLGTVNVTGGAIGNTAAFSGVLGTNSFNVSTATATVAGTATVNTATLTGGIATFNGSSNTIGSLVEDAASTANLNGTTTVGTLNAANGSTTNVGANSTIGTLGTGTGAISVTGANTLTLTNGASSATGARNFEFATTNHTGAVGTVSNITSASANGINLSGAAITFNATNTGAATDRTHYVVATDTGSGTVTGPSSLAAISGVSGYTYGIRTAANQQSVFVIQTLNANYTSTATDGAGAVNRAAIGKYLQGTLAGSYQDVSGTGLYAYLNNLNTTRVASGANSAALGHVIDQAGAQTTVQVANNLASDYMNVVSDRTGVLLGTHTASSDANGLSSGDASPGRAVWAEAFGSLGREDSRGGQAGFDTQNGGFAVGAEKKINTNSVAGLSVSYGAGQYQSNEAGAPKTTSSDDYQASIYGSSYVMQNWYVDGQIGGGYHSFDEGNTFVGVGSTSATYHGWGYFGQIGTGYDFNTTTPAMITPFAKLAYQGLASDSYTESGTPGLTRHIGSDTAQTLTGFLGAKVAWQGLSYWDTKFTPVVRAAYLHDFEQEGLSTTANFTGTGSSATFSNTGNSLAKDGYTVGLGLTAARMNGWNFDVNYDYEGRDGYNGNSGTLQAKYAF